MGYKLLGFIVWQVIRLYLRRKLAGMKRKALIGGAGAAVAAGAVVVGRQLASNRR